MALREFLHILERNGELHRTSVEIDPALELTELSIRALREGKPALFIEHATGSQFPLVVNHFASNKRIELALERHPDQIGEELIHFLERAFPPTLRAMLDNKQTVKRFFKARSKLVSSGISQEVVAAPNFDALPIQVCWPEDGGRFITYGQIITYDPRDAKRNIGIYRMHVFDAKTTGMHWQIQKGGGFHYFQSEKLGGNLELAVALGTDPALLLATVAPLPEGIDEAMFAGFLQNRRVTFTRARTISIDVPASAEFILEGVVPQKERRMEGPFGDHFGHYSAASEFPVFHLKAITHRKNPIYPAIVVGKPPMEDKFLGDATQQILGPLAKLIHKEVTDLWAYYEAGFHNLLVVAIEQRYQKEAMKAALGLMGTDQLSLTKCMITVSSGVNVRDFHAVMKEVKANFDPHYDFIMIPKVPLDTLDFTSYTMNLGSKMILDATRKPGRGLGFEVRGSRQEEKLKEYCLQLSQHDRRIIETNLIENTLLLVKVEPPLTNVPPQSSNPETQTSTKVLQKLISLAELSSLKLIALVSPDVDIQNKESYIWGVFTRFDCERDVVFTETRLHGISPIYSGVLGIDATWKPGYPKPLVMSDDIVKRIDQKWGKIWRT
ncbi:MAG: UbiD family decarboxylase [Ignavibacteriae bacterium]|nr:UbiD family decarboxylase [Ignavibacteria bacterium]MBI3365041.1 UbiD family decarboxylase [Ignavibacteriota bacterium]